MSPSILGFSCRRLIPHVDFPNADLLVFKSTGNHHHPGHVTDTRCRPDYTAAYQGHWGGKNTTHWSFIRLVGEAASKGKTLKEQEGQAISYLHYLLLTRPDLHVAQGLFTDESKVMFLFGIGGLGVNSFAVSWGNKHLYRLMYAFVYRLYDPGDFADSSYVQTELNPQKNVVTYTVQITVMTKAGSTTKIICPNLASVYASNPFGTRTHVFLDRDSKVEVNGEPLTVLKDQLCRVGTRFDEHSILKQSHNPEKVPGVVEPVYHALLDVPHCKTRQKHRMGLRQYGRPFAAISTLQSMLEVVFDILEGSLSLLLAPLCALTPSPQCCGIYVLSGRSCIGTLAKGTFSITRTISPLRLMLDRTLSLVDSMKQLGQRKCPSASSSIFLVKGMLICCVIEYILMKHQTK